MCLQEVDKVKEYESFLGGLGYSGYVGMKPNGVMGCALYWKTERFSVVRDPSMTVYNGSNQNYISLVLEHTASQRKIEVINTHLKAKVAFRDVRVA